jgi:signal transduction histidine kinase
MMSLRKRLNRGLTLILVLVFAAHWLAADAVIRFVAEDEMLTRLEHDGDSLLASLELDKDGQMRFNADPVGLIYQQLNSGHYFIIQTDAQLAHSISMGEADIAVKPTAPGTRRHYHAQGPHGQTVLVLTRGLSLQAQNLTLSVAEDLTAISEEIAQIRLAYLLLTVVILLLAIALQSANVRRALQPLAAIRADVQAVGRGQKSRIEAETPLEAQALVDEINRLLNLVDRRLNQSRNAVGNLAHALKTPLTILFRAAANPAIAAEPELGRQLREQTSLIHQRIELELKRARLSGHVQPGANFNPAQELQSLAGFLQLMHEHKALVINLAAPDKLTPYDREDMLELIGNLADNACKWAFSRVDISIVCQRDRFTLTVTDDGPGCPEPDLERLTQRGLRLDETQPGHGLGLAIVRDIVEFYHGSIKLARSPTLGGLMVTVRF